MTNWRKKEKSKIGKNGEKRRNSRNGEKWKHDYLQETVILEKKKNRKMTLCRKQEKMQSFENQKNG